MKNRLSRLLICVVAAALVPLTVSAEPPGKRGKRGKHFKKIKEMRSKMLRKRVGLDEATAQGVEAILGSFDPRRKALHKRKRAAGKALRELVRSDSNDQRAYNGLLDEMQAVQAGMATLRTEQAIALRKALTPRQAATLFGALHRMQRRMMRRMHRGGGKHEGRRSGRRGWRQRGMDHQPPGDRDQPESGEPL